VNPVVAVLLGVIFAGEKITFFPILGLGDNPGECVAVESFFL
jgi:drug/metabolite transporter (DMT)-like permease